MRLPIFVGPARAAILAAMATAALAAGPGDGTLKIDPAGCGGFTAQDAATVLGAPAAQVTRRVQKVHERLFACSYAVGKGAPGLAFSIEVAASARKAAEEMERYRDSLATAGESAPWKGRLPGGAYSDIMGVGDEAVWTEINGALTVRKANVTLQVTMPKGKRDQAQAARAVVAKW
jgi:hypothetical protein